MKSQNNHIWIYKEKPKANYLLCSVTVISLRHMMPQFHMHGTDNSQYYYCDMICSYVLQWELSIETHLLVTVFMQGCGLYVYNINHNIKR